MNTRGWLAGLLVPALLLLSAQARAITCNYQTEYGTSDNGMPYFPNPYGSKPYRLTVDLGHHTITAGRDVTLGGVLFRKRLQIDSAESFQLRCSAGHGNVYSNRRLVDLVFPPSPWNSGPYAGKIYETGLPGIGVAIVQSSTDKPLPHEGGRFPNASSDCPVDRPCNWTWGAPTQAVDVVLLKTGAVASGTVAGSSLPSAQLDFMADGVTQAELMKVNFSGQVDVVATTCTTSDVLVGLGQHMVKDLNDADRATAWQTFAIELRDCPAFHGTFPQAGGLLFSDTGQPVPTVAPQPNAVKFAIRPRSGVVDAGRGLMGLLPEGIDGRAPAATGVAVQMAMDDAASTPVVLGGALNPSKLEPLPATGQNHSIRMKARYYRHASGVTAGSADAVAEFTIDYQ